MVFDTAKYDMMHFRETECFIYVVH